MLKRAHVYVVAFVALYVGCGEGPGGSVGPLCPWNSSIPASSPDCKRPAAPLPVITLGTYSTNLNLGDSMALNYSCQNGVTFLVTTDDMQESTNPKFQFGRVLNSNSLSAVYVAPSGWRVGGNPMATLTFTCANSDGVKDTRVWLVRQTLPTPVVLGGSKHLTSENGCTLVLQGRGFTSYNGQDLFTGTLISADGSGWAGAGFNSVNEITFVVPKRMNTVRVANDPVNGPYATFTLADIPGTC